MTQRTLFMAECVVVVAVLIFPAQRRIQVAGMERPKPAMNSCLALATSAPRSDGHFRKDIDMEGTRWHVAQP